jgi:hypothetical protein
MKKMKNSKLILAMIATTVFIFTSCQKSNDLLEKSIEGRYVGTITLENGTKSTIAFKDGDATADVVVTGDGLIQVHCYGNDIDTTFMLNYFNNNDSINLCASGEDFEHMYGHNMHDGLYNNHGGMMGNFGGMMGGNTGNVDWMNHMSDNHNEGDEHYGGFDMKRNTFGYTFKNEIGDIRFQGTKQ